VPLSLTTFWMGRQRGSPLTHRLTRALAQSLPNRFCSSTSDGKDSGEAAAGDDVCESDGCGVAASQY
jgi:hypothetical protein